MEKMPCQLGFTLGVREIFLNVSVNDVVLNLSLVSQE